MRWRLKSPALWLFTQPFIQAEIKENIKAPRHWPLWGEFTGDRRITRTNGQLRGKCFHLMTSSWFFYFTVYFCQLIMRCWCSGLIKQSSDSLNGVQSIIVGRACWDASWGSVYWHGITLFPAWIRNYIHYKVRNQITYLFPKFNGAAVEVWEWIGNFNPHFIEYVITYPCWDES